MVTPLRDILAGIAGRLIRVPDEAVCAACGRVDMTYPGAADLVPRERQGVATCRCEEKRRGAARLLQQESFLPRPAKRFASFDPGVPGVRPVYDAAQRFVSREGPRALVLVGPVGSGKSHVAEAIGWHYLEEGRSVRYEKVSRMIVRLRGTYREASGDDLESWLLWYERRDLLVLDDLAVRERSETAWARDLLLTIIDYRLEYRKDMVVTTNCDKGEMVEALGERIASRLYGANPALGIVDVVPISAGDYRA